MVINLIDFVMRIVEEYGYFGIFILIFIENLFPPIPSEIILGFGGFFTSKTNLTFIGVVISATIGSIIGAVVLYYIGYNINKTNIKGYILKNKKIINIDIVSLDKAKLLYEKYKNLSVLICRCLPIVRSIISIPAGMFRMNIVKFIVYTGIGSLIWNSIVIYIGIILGENWKYISVLVREYSILIIILILVILIYLYFNNKKIKRGD